MTAWLRRVEPLPARSCVLKLLTNTACRCAPGFYLTKPYLNGLTGCVSGFFTAHDLGDNEGRVKCVLGNVDGANYDYLFYSTCVACGAGKFLDTSGMCMNATLISPLARRNLKEK